MNILAHLGLKFHRCFCGGEPHRFAMPNAKKPAGRPKASVSETLDIRNLATEWDANDDIRERLREGGSLLAGGTGEDIPTTVSNHDVLQPIIVRMSLTESRPLPAVDTLRDEVEAIYLKCKRGQNPEDVPDVIAISWKIRKLLGFLKMKVRRHEVSTAPPLQ